MRWPFGPPHLTLKPSKKNKAQKNKKKQNKKNTKKTQKNQNKERKSKKHKNTKKRAFQLSVKIFFFFDRVSKNCLFLTPWPRKRAPKNTIKIGVSAYFFWKEVMRHETAIFGQKKPKFINSSYHFFLAFFSFKNKKHKNLLKPRFL